MRVVMVVRATGDDYFLHLDQHPAHHGRYVRAFFDGANLQGADLFGQKVENQAPVTAR